jgi:hypothetical protein
MSSQPNARFDTDACRNAAWYELQRRNGSQNAPEGEFPTARAVDD